MSWLRRFPTRRGADRDLAEEMQQHLDEKTEELVGRGIAPDEAPSLARREFGNVTVLTERSRDIWRSPLDDIVSDLRYAFRFLRRSKAFAAASILMLAIGIGGNAVVFSPALDGGYTLIGVSKTHPRLYEDIPWSTAEVFQKTVERAVEIGLPVVTVPGWYDVDDAASLAILESELAGEPPFADAFPGAQAPATRAHLIARAVPLRAGSAR